MSGIEGAKVEVYREVVKPENLVAEGLTDERGFFKTTLPPAKYIILVTWVDEEGVERKIQKEEELTATTQLVVNLPAPRIVPIAERVSLVPLARLKESIAEQVSLVPEARLAESISEEVGLVVIPRIEVKLTESISEEVSLVPIVALSESIYVGTSVSIPVGWEKVADVDVTADTTTITITGLDLDAAKAYLLLFKAKNPLGVLVEWRIFFNNDKTTTNYYTQRLLVYGPSILKDRFNTSTLMRTGAGYSAYGLCLIMRTPDGLPRWVMTSNSFSPSDIELHLFAGAYVTSGNVTQIDIEASSTNGIGAGSKLILFRVRN